MKELTIEEKAKCYDEAIERAKKIHKYSSDLAEIKRIEQIFPELKESEDERISKEIIDIIDSYDVAHLRAAGLPSRIPKYIAWLEKQGKHANFLSKIQVGDKVTRNEDGELVNLSQLNRVAKPAEEYNITGIKSKNAQGKLGEMIKNLKSVNEVLEQKPADKVEPKLHELKVL